MSFIRSYTLLIIIIFSSGVISPHRLFFSEVSSAGDELTEQNTGSIKGIIRDTKGALLAEANIIIKELKLGCASDLNGKYYISNIRTGDYTLEFSYIGYKKETRQIKVTAGDTVKLDIVLTPETFQIGGIEVTGSRELLPSAPETKTVISSGEIEHYQASSVNDVLGLVPGVQLSGTIGLSQPAATTTIRSDASSERRQSLGAFGTLVLLDGVPVSNNANLRFETIRNDEAGYSHTYDGTDLRLIPADNIENIEVIRGLAPVRYGDLTSGIIKIESKTGNSPLRLKIKNNPDTREGNIGGGYSLGPGSLSFNFNAAQSERNARITGDEYTRLTGQAVYTTSLFNGKADNNSKILLQKTLDEEEPENNYARTRNYNRGYTVNFTNWGKYRPNDNVSSWEYNFYANMRRENTMKSKLVTEYLVLPSGDTVSSYIGKVESKGIEWALGSRLEWNSLFYTGDYIHKISIGIDPQYNMNTGEGIVLDTVLNYYGVSSGQRPYRFDDLPGQLLASFYMEDRITGSFIYDFTLQLGFRYEMYRPYGFNLSGLWGDGNLVKSHQGSFFNPRMNLMVYLSSSSQIRLSAGTSSKTPPMSSIYPVPSIYKWRNPSTKETVYFRFNNSSPDLKGYKEYTAEISYDYNFDNMAGLSLTGYYNFRNNEPKSQETPVFQVIDDKITFISSYTKQINIAKNESKGIEFSLRSVKIKPLNMEFMVTGAYNFNKTPSTGYAYESAPDTANGYIPNYHVPGFEKDTVIGLISPDFETWYDNLQLNYYIKYTLAPLGLWVTLKAQHVILERHQNKDMIQIYPEKLTDGELARYYYLRSIQSLPAKWIFSLNISKSLFPGAEVSFYVNNFLDDAAMYRSVNSGGIVVDMKRNPPLYYGIEFSMIFNKLL